MTNIPLSSPSVTRKVGLVSENLWNEIRLDNLGVVHIFHFK